MSDAGRKQTDKALIALERRIASVYREAADEMKQTITDYFKAFADADKKKKEALNAGQITAQQYREWKLSAIARGQRFITLRDRLANRIHRANEIAVAYINGDMAKIYAINRQYETGAIVGQGGDILKGLSFTQFDEATIRRLIVEQPDLLPGFPEPSALDTERDIKWEREQVTRSVTSSILQGKSIPAMASDLMQRIPQTSRESAVRMARTAVTAAENAGRQDAADDLQKKGVILKKQWIATSDGRTRDAHCRANGQIVDNDDFFIVGGEKLMYPGDSKHGASGWNIWQCRCSSKRIVVGFKSVLSPETKAAAKIRRVR